MEGVPPLVNSASPLPHGREAASDRPLHTAAIRRRGGTPFTELQLPEAIVTLRQGVGRLIRDPADQGLLML
ncbi:MAG: helicase C-terminal domain-containing protein, partial [Phenylobacterium sp.]|nr:helicase C-terminal domain-containing protein [Phenylobacterium sp.]